MRVVLATNNKHKVSEFRRCFETAGLDIELITTSESGFVGDVEENADSFEGNAYLKAKALCDFTGMIAIADDSGLAVDALDGAPGVYSARFAGENAGDDENIDRLLELLSERGDVSRSARFVCTICVCRPDGEHIFVRGESEGEIISERRGDGRFGYDPVFYCREVGKTFAEMSGEEKDSVSHRGRAVEKLLEKSSFFAISD